MVDMVLLWVALDVCLHKPVWESMLVSVVDADTACILYVYFCIAEAYPSTRCLAHTQSHTMGGFLV